MKKRAEDAEAKNTELTAQVAVMAAALKEIRGVACGEAEVPGLDVYSAADTDGLAWVYKRAELALSKLPAEAEKLVRLVEAVAYILDLKRRKELHGKDETYLRLNPKAWDDLEHAYRDLRGEKV